MTDAQQLFKIAHRTPGILFFNHAEKNVLGFQYLKECIVEVVSGTIDLSAIRSVLALVVQRNSKRTHQRFIRQVFVLGGVVIPILLLLVYLMCVK